MPQQGTWSLEWLLLLIVLYKVSGQESLQDNGCTFFDENFMYKIEMTRQDHDYPCTSVDSIREEFKTNQLRTLEISSDVRQLQSMVLRLIDQNNNLTKQVDSLTLELKATKQALQTHQVVSAECPAGYTVQNDEFKSCYMFVARALNWYSAQTFCESTGGYLLAVESLAEQDFLVNYIQTSNVLPGNHMWTGGNDIAQEDVWVWAGANVPFNETQWLLYPHESEGDIQMPDNHLDQEHCVHLFHLHDYAWNDIWCGYAYYFACEFKLI